MEQHDAVVAEKFGASLEIDVVEIDPDVLEHAHRHDTIERTWNVAIIFKQKFCRTGQVFFGSAGVRDLQLLVRQRYAGNIGADGLGQIQAQATPTGADVEHLV